MNVLVTGSTGFIGERVVRALIARGDAVARLVRTPTSGGSPSARWDPEHGTIDVAGLGSPDAVVHLAGENIAGGRWTSAKKQRIRKSRIDATRLLAGALAGLERRPRVLACASAVGYYGNRGSQVLAEDSAVGTGFLASVCREWEEAAAPAAAAGIRVVHLRFGVVLHPAGGALAKMLPVFRTGMGGPIGDGRQYVSWIAMDDAVGAVLHAIDAEELHGPVNVASPNPVTFADFARALGRALNRPAVLRVPAIAAKLVFGQMAVETLLASQRVSPARLLSTGYRFRWPELSSALAHLLERPRSD